MRTETPLATCSRTVDLSESAAAAEISSPRFMGPGCMTIVSGPRSASRASSRPQMRAYSRGFGKKAARMRSAWIRSIITASGFPSASAASRS